MNITVYCGAVFGNAAVYEQATKMLAKWIATNEHRLVYGGGRAGLMGVIANEVLANGGEVIGVIPTFLADLELAHLNLTTLETVETMSERKNRMAELGDCFIALPGGPGTLEEIVEVISWARIGRNNKPSIVLNIDGYYNALRDMYDQMVAAGFLDEAGRKAVLFTNDFEEMAQFIEKYNPEAVLKY